MNIARLRPGGGDLLAGEPDRLLMVELSSSWRIPSDDDLWPAAGFTDIELRCDYEAGGGPREREGYSAASTSLRV